MLQIEKALAKVESMMEPGTGIGTEYEYFQVHKAGYFETFRIFDPKPQMEVFDVGTMAGHLVLAMKFLDCKVTGTDKDFAEQRLSLSSSRKITSAASRMDSSGPCSEG